MHARLQNDLFVTTPTPSLLQENSWSLLPNPHGASPHKLWSGVGEIFIPYHTPNVSQPYIQSTTPPHPLPLMTPPPQGVSCDICNLYVPLTSFHCFRSIYLIDINLFSSSYRAQINRQDLIQTKFCVHATWCSYSRSDDFVTRVLRSIRWMELFTFPLSNDIKSLTKGIGKYGWQ